MLSEHKFDQLIDFCRGISCTGRCMPRSVAAASIERPHTFQRGSQRRARCRMYPGHHIRGCFHPARGMGSAAALRSSRASSAHTSARIDARTRTHQAGDCREPAVKLDHPARSKLDAGAPPVDHLPAVSTRSRSATRRQSAGAHSPSAAVAACIRSLLGCTQQHQSQSSFPRCQRRLRYPQSDHSGRRVKGALRIPVMRHMFEGACS